jgi:peptidoglycan/LPS O-acetylase OafA/YrhL
VAVVASSPTRVDRLLDRLSRKTTSGRYIPEVDGLRFVSIALVVLLHIEQMIGVWSGHAVFVAPFGFLHFALPERNVLTSGIAHGSVGVNVFFVISGFVLALPFVEARRDLREVDIGSYYRRRLTRIEPPYLIALLVAFVLAPLASTGSYATLLPHLVAGVAYLHGPIYGNVNRLGSPTWSLEVEMQFYVLVPVLLAFALAHRDPHRRMVRFGIIAFAGEAIWGIAYHLGVLRVNNVCSEMTFFVAGFVLAEVYVNRWGSERPIDNAYRWDWVSLLGWPALVGLWSAGIVPQMVAPFAISVLVLAAFRGRVGNRVFTNRWIATVGGMCYSIYLTHFPLLVLLGWIGRRLLVGSFTETLLLETVVLAPILLLVGALFFVAVERPCMDMRWPARFAAYVRARAPRRTAAAPARPIEAELAVEPRVVN